MIRALAIQPTNWGFAYAVLEGPEHLLAWGTFRCRDEERFLDRLEHLRQRYDPRILVVEDVHGTQRGERARRMIQLAIEQAGTWQRSSATVSRARVKLLFPETRGTKYEIAVALAERFHQLKRRLPTKRMPWLPEDRRMCVFDAVSFALVVVTDLQRPHRQTAA